jgi:hypothetical protein
MKTVWVYFAKEAQGDEHPDLIIFEAVAVQKQLTVFPIRVQLVPFHAAAAADS